MPGNCIIQTSRLLNVLWTLFRKICYGKFCLVNYLIIKSTLTLKIKNPQKTNSVAKTIKCSIDYTVMVSFFAVDV